METTSSNIRRAVIFLALAGAGGCWWFGVSILMPDLVYGWAAIALVPIFLAVAIVAGIFEFGKGEWFRGKKLLPSLLIVGGIFMIYGGVMLHVVQSSGTTPEVAIASPEKSAADAKKSKPKTMRFARGQQVKLRNLIWMFEFPGYAALGSELLQTGPLANSAYAWIHIIQDLDKRVSYNVIEILKGAKAEAAALDVLERLDAHGTGFTSPINREFEDTSKIVGERFPFAERVYIYHEPPLTKEQQKRIWEAYKKRGHYVEFRGPEYIANLWVKHGPRNEK